MAAHARPEASQRNPRRSEWRYFRRAVLLVLENLAIAGGYVLLGWLGHHLRFGEWLPLLWPAGGFALAMLLLRGDSRWPAILIGSVLASEDWIFKLGAPSPLQGHTFALLMGTGRTLAVVASAKLIHRWSGVTLWPATVREVMKLVAVAGLAYPALATVATFASLLSSGIPMSAPVSLTDPWTWFAANSTGALIVMPLILAFAAPRPTRMSYSRWEVVLLGALYVIACAFSIELGQRLQVGYLMAYPTAPLMLWAALRFGARGAAFNNLAWALVILVPSMALPAGMDPSLAFLQLQARVAVLSAATLALAASVEERQQMRLALEKERRTLEQRVAERTRELERFLSLLHSSLESTADGILVVDRRGHITAMNHRFIDLWRIPESLLETGDDAKALEFAQGQVVDRKAFRVRVAQLYAHPEQESADELSLVDGRIFERVSRPQRMGGVWSGCWPASPPRV